MSDWQIVLLRIGAMFLVICVGWIARRRDYIGAAASGLLSRLVVDVAFPALVFTQMLRSIDLPGLRQNWVCPVMGIAIVVIAYLSALPFAPAIRSKNQRHTFLFLVAIPNWVFLPLPIAEALYGAEGVSVTLLYNVGAQLALWTFGLWVLQGGGSLHGALRGLLGNLGLWATALGIGTALAFPGLRGLETMKPSDATPLQLAGSAVLQAMSMVGSLTVPLSLLAIGAQLGGLTAPVHRLTGPLWGVLGARLLLAPVITIGLVAGLAQLGAGLPEIPRMIGYLIAAMPVALSCSVMAEKFGGDTGLAAQGIFYSTFFSLATVPALFFLIQRLGL